MAKKEIMECINETLHERPFITMLQMASLLKDRCRVTLSESTVNRYSVEAGYTVKKAMKLVDHKHDNVQVKSFCERFISAYNENKLYCVDEAGFYVGDHPRKGRAKRGQRLAVASGKCLRKSKFSLGMVISTKGIVATQIMTHNFKKPDFVTFFNDLTLPKGSVILMDNLRAHHSKELKEVLDLKGYFPLFTPPYSPRCNPIEKVFGVLKPLYPSRCVQITSQDKDSFKDVFVNIIEQNRLTRFDSTYQNTLQFVKDTLCHIKTDPTFHFVGYDVSLYVRLYKDSLPITDVVVG